MSKINRRHFLKAATIAGAGAALSPNFIKAEANEPKQKSKIIKGKVNLAFIGVGLRGRNHVNNAAQRDDVFISSICDIDPDAIKKTQKLLKKHNNKEAKVYTGDEYAFMKLLEDKEIDAVVISTPWLWHTRMAVQAMKAGKYTGLEVSAANTMEECWDLVNTFEETGSHCMLLENVCYAREALAALKMVREGLFGELVHSRCGYRHDLRQVKFNDGKQAYGGGVEFGEKGFSESKWRTQHSLLRNADVYPTHGIGPVATWMDINRGNRFISLTATATKAVGLHDYIVNHPRGGKDHPNAKLKWKLGDVVTSVIKTAREETIIVTHDTNLPRPYSWGFELQGSKGIWNGEFEGRRIFIEGQTKGHSWATGDEYDKYMKKYDHQLWIEEGKRAKGAGHGGIDFFTMKSFIEGVKNDKAPEIDVYDAAAWSAITPLSEVSIINNSAPQDFPDFTRGRWINNKPIFGLEK